MYGHPHHPWSGGKHVPVRRPGFLTEDGLTGKHRVLVVDDEPDIVETHRSLLDELGYESLGAHDPAHVEDILRKFPDVDLLLLDVRMPQISGLELTRRLRLRHPTVGIILATVLNDIQLAVQATKSGAYNYLLKPLQSDRLGDVLRSYFANRPKRMMEDARFAGFITAFPRFETIFRTVKAFAEAEVTVLIEGETGTGKELIAELIHSLSPRASEKFLAVNIAAITEDLFESELFGHRRGSFTGASQDHAGYLETAGAGTIFLDEIGEITPKQQTKLLRVVETRRFCRVGETTERTLDARIVLATNRDLKAEAKAGRFREDLYYRLSGRLISLPPLRERTGDVRLLTEYFLGKYCSQFGRSVEGVEPTTLDYLERYPFPGNVRELEGVISGAVLLETEARLQPGSLPQHFIPEKPEAPGATLRLPTTMDEAVEHVVHKALAATGGNQTRAARQLGVSRQWLNTFLKDQRERK